MLMFESAVEAVAGEAIGERIRLLQRAVAPNPTLADEPTLARDARTLLAFYDNSPRFRSDDLRRLSVG